MTINWYAHHLGDYEKDTKILTMLEHGAYRLLLDYYYSNKGPIPADFKSIHRACLAHTPTERRAVEKVLLKYFSRGDGIWYHPRADKELQKQRLISESKRENVKKRWNGKDTDVLHPLYQPATSNQQPSKLASNGHDQEEEFCEEEILPSRWQDIAEARGIPNEQIFSSWRRFKDKTGFPLRLSRWTAWVSRERIA